MIATAKRAKVLVIDDELGPRESLRVLLKNEYEVRCVNSVDLGVQILRELEPDVIVMDIRMPGKTGIEGLREIRSLDPHVAVIMLTGFGALETAQEALRLGANDYLKKPFDIVEMQDVIRANVHRSQINRRRASTEHELQALNGQLTSQLEKKDLMATLGQASAELVHDLRNPLAAVLGYVQILSEDLAKARETQHGTPEATTEYIGLIEQNIQRCREMVEAWQDISRPQRRKPEPMRPLRSWRRFSMRSAPWLHRAMLRYRFELKTPMRKSWAMPSNWVAHCRTSWLMPSMRCLQKMATFPYLVPRARPLHD
ncbi:MAG: response regulator [Kiritimatiellae bacterium]|nr:response regulator [Kiritimatiellia bacterium]